MNNALLIIGGLYLLSQKKGATVLPGGMGTYQPTATPRPGSTQAKAQQAGKSSGSSSSGGPFSAGAGRGGDTSWDDPTFWAVAPDGTKRELDPTVAQDLLKGDTFAQIANEEGYNSVLQVIDDATGSHLTHNGDIVPVALENAGSTSFGPSTGQDDWLSSFDWGTGTSGNVSADPSFQSQDPQYDSSGNFFDGSEYDGFDTGWGDV